MTEYPELPRNPYERVHLEGEEPRKRDKAQVGLNDTQRKLLNEIKELTQIPYESRIFTLALESFRNVLRYQIGDEGVKYMCSQRRNKKA